ncbi:type II toxin-antitoxin system RelE/ParE family toxin [Rhodospirillum sp. A1_3_36]|uniref:type II toxin-antitoxin system RelE/ParE family toxin n=1 Tax=Rhodospirillum sp. A1_3_36 TaxID=3391666 RepID=UPI0039A54222
MADFYLTRRAYLDLEVIHAYSREHWGDRVASAYMDDLYAAFQRMAEDPSLGTARRHRSHPFLMAPAERHFAVYEQAGTDIIIATVQHMRRDIETLIAGLEADLLVEINRIRQSIKSVQ